MDSADVTIMHVAESQSAMAMQHYAVQYELDSASSTHAHFGPIAMAQADSSENDDSMPSLYLRYRCANCAVCHSVEKPCPAHETQCGNDGWVECPLQSGVDMPCRWSTAAPHTAQGSNVEPPHPVLSLSRRPRPCRGRQDAGATSDIGDAPLEAAPQFDSDMLALAFFVPRELMHSAGHDRFLRKKLRIRKDETVWLWLD